MRMRLLGLVLLAACASGPIPTGQKPLWVNAPQSDLKFPPDKFVSAVGSTTVGQKPAPELLGTVDAAARASLAASLASTISSEVNSFESVQTKNGQTEEKLSAEMRVKQVVSDFDLTPAMEIAGRWREGDTAYAWAVLDKAKAQALQQGKVADHEKLSRELLAQGAKAEEDGAPADALRAFARARTEADAALGGVLLLRALGGKAEVTGTVAEAEGKLGTLLGKLVLTVVDGDGQRAAEGKALAQPVRFTAWMAGKPAAGLPIAANVPGGRAEESVVVGPDAKGSVRVDDIGKFTKPEQQIQLGIDWARLLGVTREKAPAWTAVAPKASATAVALKKGVETTRVLVLLYEKVDGGNAVSEPPVSSTLATTLSKAGFDVQDSKALITRYGAERLSALSDKDLREAAKGKADVVVIGTVTSRYSSNFGSTTVWHRARAEVRAVDMGTGQVVFTSPAEEVKSERPGELNVAGRSALEAMAKALGPNLEAALKKAAAQ